MLISDINFNEHIHPTPKKTIHFIISLTRGTFSFKEVFF